MDIWDKLYAAARKVQNKRTISPFIEAGEVAAAILTKSGNIYVGICIDTACGLGMCAERNAAANMLTNGENEISKVVAVMGDGKVGPPCGVCREYLMQLGESNAAALRNKISKIITRNGMADAAGLFVVTPTLTVTDDGTVDTGMTTVHVVRADLTLSVKNLFENTVFASQTVSLQANGKSEEACMRSLINKVNVNDVRFAKRSRTCSRASPTTIRARCRRSSPRSTRSSPAGSTRMRWPRWR